MALTYGSLFTGVGGLDLGFDKAGFQCLWQVEWDKHCQATLNYHWPTVPKFLDICGVNGAQLEPADVITFGSPCQDLSVAGKQKGLGGTKSAMFFEAVRVINEMREATSGQYPRVALWENVPGALRSNGGADFDAVIKTLANSGAVDIEWRVLDAQFFGIAARRRRLFLVAVYDPTAGTGNHRELLPINKINPGNPQSHQDATIGFYRTHGIQDQPQIGVAPTLKAITPVCIIGPSGEARALTPLEHERLMGWPDNHTLFRADGKVNSDTVRYKMCGNGVATAVAYWVAKQLAGILSSPSYLLIQ